jgi:molecular chaperone DnaK
MENYIGIDLGTSNSVIASYDLKRVTIWKNDKQNEVTPSVIYINRKGNKYYGNNANERVITSPEDTATLFKRLLGTKKIFNFKASGIAMSPEECSAEIIKVLLGFVPNELKDNGNIKVVITVPANFDTIKKNATLEAAQMAGIRDVILLQEPIAAIIGIQEKNDHKDGYYVIYDIGGGTFDVTIAKKEYGKIRILSSGGIDMCGGRDIDVAIYDKIVKPWLEQNFKIDFTKEKYRTIKIRACKAIEDAKIELSFKESTKIVSLEEDMNICDEEGNDIFLDIDLNQTILNDILKHTIDVTVEETLKNIKEANLTVKDFTKIVFVGGPTMYPKLREEVSKRLEIPYENDVDPMTVVATGASIYAESIEWNAEQQEKKTNIDTIQMVEKINFSYYSRVTTDTISIISKMEENLNIEYQLEITSKDTGWCSGRITVENEKMIEIPVQQEGKNSYELIIFDNNGNKVYTEEINVIKTFVSIDAATATHAIGIEVKEAMDSNKTVIEYFVEKGEELPKTGQIKLKNVEPLKAGELKSFIFNLWEGEGKKDPYSNRYIGCLKITGTDFDYGFIEKFSDIICKYEVSDAGTVKLNIEIPSIHCIFGQDKNFYSRQEGKIGLEDIDNIVDKGSNLLNKIEQIAQVVDNEEIQKARKKVVKSMEIKNNVEATEEDVQRAENEQIEAKEIIYKEENKKDNIRSIKQIYLKEEQEYYHESVERLCKEEEKKEIIKLMNVAQMSIDTMNYNDFDHIINELKNMFFNILFWREDSFAIGYFQEVLAMSLYNDMNKAQILINKAKEKILEDKIEQLREICCELSNMRILNNFDYKETSNVNIIKGG